MIDKVLKLLRKEVGVVINPSDFIIAIMSAAEEPAILALQSGLDSIYQGIEKKVNNTESPIDDKVLEIFTKAITTWEPKK